MARLLRLAAVLASLALAAALAACGDDDDGGDDGEQVSGVQALPDSSCGEVEYGGEGDPAALIASDLPLQGDLAEQSEQMNDAIRLELENAGWQAGESGVAFQACDDSIETGEFDEARCRENAQAYAENPDLVGVIGTFNSGCAAEIIPVLNEAPDGALAMVSPGNTAICLTAATPTCEAGQPDSLYPSGGRNYVRVVPNDAIQAAGLAAFAQEQQVQRPFVLIGGDDPKNLEQGNSFAGAAEQLGMEVAGTESWDPEATDYTALMNKVKASGADAVVLAGLLDQNMAQLIKDKVAVLGPNQGDRAAAQLFALWQNDQETIDQGGPETAGMFVSDPGQAPATLTGAGETFVAELEGDLDGEEVNRFAPYSGQAAQVLLDAIAGGPTRADVLAALLKTQVVDGIVGSFAFTPYGDPTPAPISISVAAETFEFQKQIVPPQDLIDAALAG